MDATSPPKSLENEYLTVFWVRKVYLIIIFGANSILEFMMQNSPTFSRQDSLKFFRTLNSRVNDYFKENNIKKTGNWKWVLKEL